MNSADSNPNPYQTPQTGQPHWFRWSRLPYGLYRGYLGYVAQMREDGASVVGHMACWIGILLVSLLGGLILWLIAVTILGHSSPQ